ncbi:23S rRNA pseudouridine(1911/1915/1917) synthase RluD [Sediminicurvatus halobius]|uniref:Pseudouridine synthase n=1 Tax=Sediminicurvatus halobius TaxID=2182432 RepID=A0A2U2N0G7_9GAMM|nr:23S rRNA pseudouridine(1911/1915/1917) synthase RluD [Spiribacter halobius]PWG62620.1 23S rRNA pseudouridine(1911/1915/1917) synthase RluD [Spiribacter halobius]UEX78461.1 23S rRNA pseudouridine(1911/1915/1917) synthase RluD [Spiribacter halobius]
MSREETIQRAAVIPEAAAGQRLDRALAELFPEFSRSRLQRWLREGALRVDGATPRPRAAVQGGEQVVLEAVLEAEGPAEAEAIPLTVVHEDDSLLVIDKPAGLVVHPGAGNREGTLQNALLHHDPALAAVPRAGIVHRLDRETSGLMVVARTLPAHTDLVAQLQARSVGREYLALVAGTFTAGGHVEAAIGRHPRDRLRMAVREDGKPAVTHYRIERRFPAHTLLRCRLETGRTHQIRVHMAHIRHPIVGDPLYGGRLRLPPGADKTVTDALRGFRRQALHAERLTLRHPATGETLSWTSPLPADFDSLLRVLADR